jgi:hypothetical protein
MHIVLREDRHPAVKDVKCPEQRAIANAIDKAIYVSTLHA